MPWFPKLCKKKPKEWTTIYDDFKDGEEHMFYREIRKRLKMRHTNEWMLKYFHENWKTIIPNFFVMTDTHVEKTCDGELYMYRFPNINNLEHIKHMEICIDGDNEEVYAMFIVATKDKPFNHDIPFHDILKAYNDLIYKLIKDGVFDYKNKVQ